MTLEEIYANLTEHDALERAEGKAEGLQEGERNMRIKMIKKLLAQGKNDQEICDFVEISLSEFDDIKLLLEH
jgi:hypothetical protein